MPLIDIRASEQCSQNIKSTISWKHLICLFFANVTMCQFYFFSLILSVFKRNPQEIHFPSVKQSIESYTNICHWTEGSWTSFSSISTYTILMKKFESENPFKLCLHIYIFELNVMNRKYCQKKRHSFTYISTSPWRKSNGSNLRKRF